MGKVVAFIPVRGGSKSIPLKNIKPLLGKPLVYWTAAAASACTGIDEVYVSTDSLDIKKAVEACKLPKVRVIERSAATATDAASSESALLEFAENHEFETVVFIQATSPLLEPADLARGLALIEQPGCDSVISVVEDKHFYWSKNADGTTHPVNYDVFKRPRRQDFDGCYQENGAFYITERERLLNSRNRVSGAIWPVTMAEDTLFEIDEPADWRIIEALLQRKLAIQDALASASDDAAEATRKSDKSGFVSANYIGLFLTDCDGCLTDGGMYYDGSTAGEAFKKFNTRDGMGIARLRQRGIKTGIITGENSAAAKMRAEKLQMDYCILECSDKLAAAQALCEQEGISLAQVAYVGDDVNDVALLRAAGMSFSPADGMPEARRAASTVLEACGGQGAVREAAELVLER